MYYNQRSLLAALATAGAIVFGASAAQATCVTSSNDCQNDGGSLTSLTIGGTTGTSSIGKTIFAGENGGGNVFQDGGSGIDIRAYLHSDLCPDGKCDQLGGGLDAYAYETINLDGNAFTNDRHTPAELAQQTATATKVTASLPNYSLEAGINAGTAGSGVSKFSGGGGYGEVVGGGYNVNVIDLRIDGLCPSCTDGGLKMEAQVGQHMQTLTEAYGGHSGKVLSVESGTATAAEITHQFMQD